VASDLLPPSIDDPHSRKEHVHRVRGTNRGGARSEVTVRDFRLAMDEPEARNGTNTAQSPLETVVSALIGCKGATINSVAHAMRFAFAGIASEAASVIDLRGPRGVRGVRPYFESVGLRLVLYTDEPERRVTQLIRNVEHRCPVANLLRAADVDLRVQWETRPAAEAPRDAPPEASGPA